jgi:hypothetical protein
MQEAYVKRTKIKIDTFLHVGFSFNPESFGKRIPRHQQMANRRTKSKSMEINNGGFFSMTIWVSFFYS